MLQIKLILALLFGADSNLTFASAPKHKSEYDNTWAKKHGGALTVLGHLFGRTVRRYVVQQSCSLTLHENDALAFIYGGINSIQISQHLRLTSRTVEGALTPARDCLNVQNTAATASKALVSQFI